MTNNPGYSMNAPDMWHLTMVQIIEGKIALHLHLHYKFSKNIDALTYILKAEILWKWSLLNTEHYQCKRNYFTARKMCNTG